MNSFYQKQKQDQQCKSKINTMTRFLLLGLDLQNATGDKQATSDL